METTTPIFRHSPWWSIATASFGSISAFYALGTASAGGPGAWFATFLIIAAALALAGIVYAVLLRHRARDASWGPIIAAALCANLGTFGLALTVAVFLRW
jgi:predicted membrane channel-forming protein YqfA (hemolysin III family)